MSTEQQKLSPIEHIKTASNYLAGNIAEELADQGDSFSKDNQQLLKNHGTYQQDDRDARAAARSSGEGKHFSFMVRTKIPAGKLTSEQLLAELDLCDEVGNTTLRITSRQGLQLHGVIKQDLKKTIARINEIQLSTLAACGDVERNVMAPAAPYKGGVYDELQNLASRLAEHLCPRTTAYHEIWLTDPSSGEETLVGGGAEGHEIEPIYGPTYLPRKFKTGIGLPDDNSVDLYTHDLGLMAIVEDNKIIGYNVLVGGGLGVTPSAKKTFPALGKRMCFVTPEQVIDVATEIIKVQRDFGNREDRKVARLKYLIHDWGIERFKSKVEEYYGQSLPDPHPADVTGFDDYMGWREQGDGLWFYGLNVENGRLLDSDQLQIKAAIRKICHTLKPGIRLTPHQSILFTDIAPENKSVLEAILKEHRVKLTEEISAVRRWSMACVAWPTCGLSITEAERALPGIIDQLEVELAKLGLDSDTFTVRMTGCPNGCARPYNSDVGLVGKTANKYSLFLGGRLLGNRLNFLYKDLVPTEEVVSSLVPVFAYFKAERQDGETFGDFCNRQGLEAITAWAEKFAA